MMPQDSGPGSDMNLQYIYIMTGQAYRHNHQLKGLGRFHPI